MSSTPGPILLVEDRDIIRRAMTERLHDIEGYQVLTARDGEAALATLSHVHPCVIVLDLTMPRMDGFAFRMQQLRHPSLRDIPTIAWSADPALRARAEALGLRFLRKPIDLPALLDFVGRHCQRSQPK